MSVDAGWQSARPKCRQIIHSSMWTGNLGENLRVIVTDPRGSLSVGLPSHPWELIIWCDQCKVSAFVWQCTWRNARSS